MFLKDPLLETRHEGKLVMLRVVASAPRASGLLAVVEDGKGAIDRVFILYYDPDADPRYDLPVGKVIGIKEPLYGMCAMHRYALRVDHPCDTERYCAEDPSIPSIWQARISHTGSAMDWKEEGNGAYLERDYIRAIEW